VQVAAVPLKLRTEKNHVRMIDLLRRPTTASQRAADCCMRRLDLIEFG
jgi:hypothetical protein